MLWRHFVIEYAAELSRRFVLWRSGTGIKPSGLIPTLLRAIQA